MSHEISGGGYSAALRAEVADHEIENIYHMIEKSSLPAVELFTDERKFRLYAWFKEYYGGEPFGGAELPELKRTRSGQEVTYDHVLLSGITKSCSHMVHVRQALHSEGAASLAHEQKYLVATTDFGTGDTTEWFIEPILAQAGYSGNQADIKLKLILHKDPVEQATQFQMAELNSTPLEGIRIERILEIMAERAEAQKIVFSIDNNLAELSWGNFRVPETFIGLHAIESQLWWLRKAERKNLLGNVRSNEAIRQHSFAA